MRYRPELDGLRSIAVYLVLAYHAGLAVATGGFVGVDLFFVLSGFLVTGVLLRDVRTEGRVRLGRFYARRVRRLLPAAVVVVCATAALQLLLLSLPARLDLVDDARATVLYVANWHFIGESSDYFAQVDAPSPFLHFWSLSIEEQFYIVFPVLVLAITRWSRRPVRTLAGVLVVLGAASVALQLWAASYDATLAYYGTHTRLYQLAAGALLLVVVTRTSPEDESTRPGRAPWVLGQAASWAGLALVLVCASDVLDLTASHRGLLVTVGAVATVAGLWSAPRSSLGRLLALPVPRYLGQISYGTYLWHWPVVLLLRRFIDTDPVVLTALTAAVATGLAALSYQVLEQPIRRARPLHRVPWPVVGAGLLTSALVVVAVLPAVLESTARPAVAAQRTTGASGVAAEGKAAAPVPEGLDIVEASQDFGIVTTKRCTASKPTACQVVDGPGTHVLLLGDSQAATFVPAFEDLARERGWRLSTNVRSGCPWQVDQVNTARNDTERQEACFRARDEFLVKALPAMDVDVVVAIGLARSDSYWADKITSREGPPGETLTELQDRTTRLTADLVTDAGARLVIAHSVFGTETYSIGGFDPIECLAAARQLADCAVVPPRRQPVVDDVYGTLALESDDIATIDLTDTVCPDYPICLPVLDGIITWIDPAHVGATFLQHRRGSIADQLDATGFF